MRRDVLFSYLDNTSIYTGDLLAFYPFNETSGVYVFNEKYSKSSQIISGGLVDKNKYPAYILNQNRSDTTSVSGSGTFDGQTILRVGENVEDREWTIFINYSREEAKHKHLGTTLLSSMNGAGSASGFNIGINGANRLYLEYPDINKNKIRVGLDKELAQKNVISIAKNLTSIDLSYHNFAEREDHASYFSLTNNISGSFDSTNSDVWYIGDLFEQNIKYTGFSGHIDDVVIFKNYLNERQRNELGKAFFAIDYSGERYGFETIQRNVITGSGIPRIEITGSGVISSSFVSGQSIQTRYGSGIPSLFESGVTGLLSGEVIFFPTGTGIITSTRAVKMSEEFFFDEAFTRTYGRKNLVFNSPTVDYKDFYEVYSYAGFKENLNKTSSIAVGGDFFSLGSGFTGQNINFYLNGQLLKSGTVQINGELISGEYRIDADSLLYISGGEIYEDDAVYDEIVGQLYHTGYVTGASDLLISGSFANNNDIYLNGQKLISGFNYTVSGSTAIIDRDTILAEDGLLSFTPRDLIINKVTGSTSSLIQNNFTLTSEQVWLNGLRQIKDINYFTITDKSLLNTGIRLESQGYIVYNNDGNFFNL